MEGARQGTQNPRESHHVGGAVFSKAFIQEVRFRDGIRHWDGRELYRRMVSLGARIEYHDGPTWVYRKHAGSMSNTDLETRAKILGEIEA